MSGFIDLLLEHTREYESPTSFWKWSALTSISAVLRDNVFVPDGDSKLFPNIYVLFLADSGARKNRPVVFSESLLTKVDNTKIISGRASIQAILDELARVETKASTGKLNKAGSAIFYAPELAAGLVESAEAISILTDIYDGKTNFTSILRHSPKFRVERIVFSALMASNETMIRGVFDGRATQGGLLARTLLIVPDEFRAGNSLMEYDQQKEDDRTRRYDCLVTYLTKISEMRGMIRYTKDARDEHENWYHPFRNGYLQKGDKAGIAGRLHTTIKKVAILLAANDLSDMIEGRHMEQSIDMCMALLPNYNIFIMSTGKSQISEAGSLFLKDLLEATAFTLERKEILRRRWSDFDAEMLDKMVVTLEGAGVIRSIVAMGKIEYQLTESYAERMTMKKRTIA